MIVNNQHSKTAAEEKPISGAVHQRPSGCAPLVFPAN
jgi:hypothetical protein